MPLRFTLRQLEYFVAVGEAGSIALAAERVRVSAPSISAAIAQLEEVLGVQLFLRRHAQGLALTTGGRLVLAEAKRLLAQAEGLGGLATDIAQAVRGPLVLGCLVTFVQLVLPELRRRFEARYPDVTVTQAEGHQARLFDLLRDGGIDAALTYDLDIPADLAFEGFAELPPWVMLPAAHPLAGRARLMPEDLHATPMVLIDLPFSADYLLSAFSATGDSPPVRERTRDMGLAQSLVANGYGFALVNVRPELDRAPDGKLLAYIPLEGGPRPLRLGLATARAGRRSRSVAAFAEHCRATIAAEGVPGLARAGT